MREPLSGGPFRGFLDALHRLQAAFPSENAPIRTALVTARSAPAHKRVILTLREWGVRIDEALFLGGRDKGPFLDAFGADIFFDDSAHNVESARQHVATGHVPRRRSCTTLVVVVPAKAGTQRLAPERARKGTGSPPSRETGRVAS